MPEITPIAGACVWRGDEMARSDRWRRRLSAAQLAEIDAAVARARARGLGWEQVTAEAFPLPGLKPLFDDIRAELEEGSGLLLLQGLDPSRYDLDRLGRCMPVSPAISARPCIRTAPAKSCGKFAT